MSALLLRDLVAQALRDGDLYHGSRRTKTLTVCGRRLYRIRLQSDIFRAVYDRAALASEFYYPELASMIGEYVADWRVGREAKP